VETYQHLLFSPRFKSKATKMGFAIHDRSYRAPGTTPGSPPTPTTAPSELLGTYGYDRHH
jgi:hypothetical protein